MNGVKSLGDKKLSIIVPAYNEGGNIGALLDKVLAVRLPYDIRREVMVVDDGSSDNTYDIVRKYVELHPGEPVRLLRHERNRGKGRAIRTALEYVTGDYIIIQDGDLELEPNDIAVLLKVLVDGGYEVVYGSRFLDKRNEVLYRRFYWGGRLVSFVANLLYNQNITDEPTCYKLFRAEVMERIRLRCERFEFCPEVTAKVAKLGIKIHEEPIHYMPRTLEEGKKLRWTDGVKAVWTLIKYRFTD